VGSDLTNAGVVNYNWLVSRFVEDTDTAQQTLRLIPTTRLLHCCSGGLIGAKSFKVKSSWLILTVCELLMSEAPDG
jgi:hypothetical protein